MAWALLLACLLGAEVALNTPIPRPPAACFVYFKYTPIHGAVGGQGTSSAPEAAAPRTVQGNGKTKASVNIDRPIHRCCSDGNDDDDRKIKCEEELDEKSKEGEKRREQRQQR